MKTKRFFILLGLLAAIMAVGCLAGCGGGNKKTAVSPPTAAGPAQPAKQAPAAEETLASIMMKAKHVPGYTSDIIMTAPGFSSRSKMSFTKDKMRIENAFDGKTMITIVNGDTTYLYEPSSQTAMKFSGKDLPAEMGGKIESPAAYEQTMVKDSVKFIESVVYDGVRCRVVSFTDKETGATAKMWLREDYGLPAKQEMISKNGEKMTIEYKNMIIGVPPADYFILPAGVKIQDIGALMQNRPKGSK